MSETKKTSYLLISKSDEGYKQLSHEELQKLMAANEAWVGRLMAGGKARPGVALARDGATVSGKRVVLDGPFAESKEAIGGTLVLDVATLEEAITIARECPGLRYNMTIEVRPISDECPIDAWAREKLRVEHLAAAAA